MADEGAEQRSTMGGEVVLEYEGAGVSCTLCLDPSNKCNHLVVFLNVHLLPGGMVLVSLESFTQKERYACYRRLRRRRRLL